MRVAGLDGAYGSVQYGELRSGTGGITLLKNPDGSYYLGLDMGIDLLQQIVFNYEYFALINGNVHAEYGAIQSQSTPEPGTLVMLLGLAAGLAVYGWKRRAAR